MKLFVFQVPSRVCPSGKPMSVNMAVRCQSLEHGLQLAYSTLR